MKLFYKGEVLARLQRVNNNVCAIGINSALELVIVEYDGKVTIAKEYGKRFFKI